MKRVLIVGAGPVGLFLACLLGQRGTHVQVLERRGAASRGTRSIGLHPPALEALASIGLADPLLDCGVAISSARVYDGGRYLGSLSLAACPGPFPFVLSLPQAVTERLLEERLARLAPGALRRGAEVESVRAGAGAEVRLREGERVTADLLVACDGHGSRSRRDLRARTHHLPSSHRYLMADVEDTSDLGSEAAFFLASNGVVESFPLPGNRRRWVARLDSAGQEYALLRRVVAERTGHHLPEQGEASSFAGDSTRVEPLAGPRWALAGDAAHVVSPIGGQGMNLGLIGALALVEAGLGGGGWQPNVYDRCQRRRARRAVRRARFNMLLGGERIPAAARRAVLAALLSPAVAGGAARYFTMRGL